MPEKEAPVSLATAVGLSTWRGDPWEPVAVYFRGFSLREWLIVPISLAVVVVLTFALEWWTVPVVGALLTLHYLVNFVGVWGSSQRFPATQGAYWPVRWLTGPALTMVALVVVLVYLRSDYQMPQSWALLVGSVLVIAALVVPIFAFFSGVSLLLMFGVPLVGLSILTLDPRLFVVGLISNANGVVDMASWELTDPGSFATGWFVIRCCMVVAMIPLAIYGTRQLSDRAIHPGGRLRTEW